MTYCRIHPRLRSAAAFLWLVTLLVFASVAGAQQSTSARAENHAGQMATETLAKKPWDWGPFFNGGFGTGNRSDYHFLSPGVHVGKVLTPPAGPGLLRGQFEYAAELMPWWQGYAPPFQRYTVTPDHVRLGPYPTGGAYNGVSITPILLRWNLVGARRVLPFVQGGGGMIWTNHKFPPVGPLPPPGHQGTSVWNFTPQFGIGLQYFIRPRRSITLGANAVHISNSSLGDANPGVNASVQFQLGYTWWK